MHRGRRGPGLEWRAAWLVALIAAGACGEGNRERSAAPGGEAPRPEAPAVETAEGPSGARRAPAVSFATLEGGSASLADLRGHVAIVNFWGTWCLPCRTELPELAELADRFADRGVRVVGIAVDSGDPDAIAAFAAEYGVDYEVWTADMQTAVADFGAVGFPFTLLLDREGWIRKEYLGPQTEASLSREIEALLR